MRVLLIGDIHLADKPPSLRIETYTEEILDKLSFSVELANQQKVDALVLLGDVLHVKAPSKTSHSLVQRIIDTLIKSNSPVKIVPGNHDLQHDRLQSISHQPLGTIVKVDGIDLLIGPDPVFPMFGIPYLSDFLAQLPGWMRVYCSWVEELQAKQWDAKPLLVTHAPIFPPGSDPPYEYVAAQDWAQLMGTGSCAYGHIHDPHGVYDVGLVRFCNNGAISRGSLHEQTLKREPCVTLWSSVTNEFEKLPIPYKPAEEVFRLTEKELSDERAEKVAEFLDGVEKTVFETLSLEQVISHAESQGLRKRALEELRSCIEETQ